MTSIRKIGVCSLFSDCGAEWYRSDIISENNLICAWRDEGKLFVLDPEVLLDICKAE